MITTKSKFEQGPGARETFGHRQPSVRRSFLDLTRDAVELAELQAKLARQEARQGVRGLVAPIVALVIAVVIGLGAVPIVLILIAQSLIEFADFGATAAYGIATGIGLIMAAVAAATGWLMLKNRVSIFDRTIAELKQNVTWFKHVVGATEDS